MSSIPSQHKQQAPRAITCAVLTVSDTRSLNTDRGGAEIIRRLEAHGHTIAARDICADDPTLITGCINGWRNELAPDAILVTGGTGISPRDHTYETISQILTKPIPGYGELFRWLSYQEIGSAAMLSRTVGGLVDRTLVLTMPGSPAAVQLAMDKLILPELGHLVQQAHKSSH